MSLRDEVCCRVKFAAMSELLCNPFSESEFEQESVEPGHFEASKQDKIRSAVKDKAKQLTRALLEVERCFVRK